MVEPPPGDGLQSTAGVTLGVESLKTVGDCGAGLGSAPTEGSLPLLGTGGSGGSGFTVTFGGGGWLIGALRVVGTELVEPGRTVAVLEAPAVRGGLMLGGLVLGGVALVLVCCEVPAGVDTGAVGTGADRTVLVVGAGAAVEVVDVVTGGTVVGSELVVGADVPVPATGEPGAIDVVPVLVPVLVAGLVAVGPAAPVAVPVTVVPVVPAVPAVPVETVGAAIGMVVAPVVVPVVVAPVVVVTVAVVPVVVVGTGMEPSGS